MVDEWLNDHILYLGLMVYNMMVIVIVQLYSYNDGSNHQIWLMIKTDYMIIIKVIVLIVIVIVIITHINGCEWLWL